jgi:phytoene dehydrogenase-like protein
MKDFDVIIIGAGISGLTVANYLKETDLKIKVLEAENAPGGRVRSFEKDGFILDRGFQVFLPAYPEAKKILDYDKLNLQYFMNGAYVMGDTKPFYIIDPLSNPRFLFSALFDNNLSFNDKLKLFQLRKDVLSKSVKDIFNSIEISSREKIKDNRYSLYLIRSFFQPFLSGIFFERELNTSSRMFEFVIKMFNEGGAAIPSNGMGEISKQLYNNLAKEVVDLNTKVTHIENGNVKLENGEELKAASIVMAVEGNSDLLNKTYEPNNSSLSSSTYYFSCPSVPPVTEPILILNRNESLNINNLCFQSQVSKNYAPDSKSLLSVTVVKDSNSDESRIKSELIALFGKKAESWEFIEKVHIPYSLPVQNEVKGSRSVKDINPREGLYIAGDHTLYGSINAAMQSGREVAELIMNKSN